MNHCNYLLVIIFMYNIDDVLNIKNTDVRKRIKNRVQETSRHK